MTNVDLEALAQAAYSHGIEPLDWAEGLITDLVRLHLAGHPDDPGGVGRDVGRLSCRILGALIEAGWAWPESPP